MAKNLTHDEELKNLVSQITDIIRGHQEFVTESLQTAKKKTEYIDAMFNEQAIKNQTLIIREEAKTEIFNHRDTALNDLAYKYAEVMKVLQSWVVEPVPTAFSSIATAVRDFDMKLSPAELTFLSQDSTGSYFASKILNGLARKEFYDIPFHDLTELISMVNSAEADSKIAVSEYCGSLDNNGKNIQSWAASNPDDWVSISFAADYLHKEESSLTRLASALESAVSKDITLLPNEHDRISKLFAGFEGEKYLERMIDLLVTQKDLDGKLLSYDAATYKIAKKKILEENREQRELAIQAVKAAAKKAEEAMIQAKIAAIEEANARRIENAEQ